MESTKRLSTALGCAGKVLKTGTRMALVGASVPIVSFLGAYGAAEAGMGVSVRAGVTIGVIFTANCVALWHLINTQSARHGRIDKIKEKMGPQHHKRVYKLTRRNFGMNTTEAIGYATGVVIANQYLIGPTMQLVRLGMPTNE